MLKTANNRLIKTPAKAICDNGSIPDVAEKRSVINQPIAIAILAIGPASATQIISCLGDLSALKLIGTGFAQPKISPPGISKRIAGTNIVPTGSMCFIGLSVTRPIILAV